MKYLDIKLIEKKVQEDTDKYTVIVVYIDGEKYQITDILKTHMDAPRFAAAIKKMAMRKFPGKQFKTFYVVGTDGKKVDGYDFEILRRDELDPDGELPKKSDDTTDTKGEIEPETNNDAIKLPDAEEVDIVDAEKEIGKNAITGFTIMDANEFKAIEYVSKRAKTIDKDKDGIHDETGEVLPLIYNDGTLRDPNNKEKVVGTVPGYVEPTPSKFAPARDSESGEEGEGGLTGEQSGSAPDIADEIYEAIDGLGTDEGRLRKALERIETRPHLFEIIKQYKEKYNSSMSTDILDDFKYDFSNYALIDEVNYVMSKLGYVLYGSKFFTLSWVDTSKIKISGNYVGYQPKIGWHKGIIISIQGRSFGVSPFKKDGWLGTSIGEKYAMGPVEPRDNPDAPPNIGVEGQISRFTTIEQQVGMKPLKAKYIRDLIDNYIKDNINDNGVMPPVKVGDTIDLDVYRMLTFLGDKGNGMLWAVYDEETNEYRKLSQEAADAINNYKGETE
tara:strand:+ start:440 stop:1942 length:1503 start_codon:yes stop_codon:yes gene_type:complete